MRKTSHKRNLKPTPCTGKPIAQSVSPVYQLCPNRKGKSMYIWYFFLIYRNKNFDFFNDYSEIAVENTVAAKRR